MASYASTALLNIAADAATAQAIEVHLHSGAPGNAGSTNRIGTVAATVAATGWTAAASGASETTAATAFGVLSTSAMQTVRAYSLWRGRTFLGWADLASPVAVAANEAFTLAAGSVEIQFARP